MGWRNGALQNLNALEALLPVLRAELESPERARRRPTADVTILIALSASYEAYCVALEAHGAHNLDPHQTAVMREHASLAHDHLQSMISVFQERVEPSLVESIREVLAKAYRA